MNASVPEAWILVERPQLAAVAALDLPAGARVVR